MKYLKFIPVFLFNFIIVNKVKSIAIVLACLLFPFVGSFKDKKSETLIYKEMKIDNQWCYLYHDDGDIEMKSFSQKQTLHNGKLVEYEFNDANVISWVGFIILCLFIVIPIFANDSDLEYEMDDVFTKTLSFFVECEVEDDYYIYHSFGKLLSRERRKYNGRNIANHFGISLTGLRNCPDYQSIQRKRHNTLNKLGI
jgi:hypothetical protein